MRNLPHRSIKWQLQRARHFFCGVSPATLHRHICLTADKQKQFVTYGTAIPDMEDVIKLLKYLPEYAEIKHLLENEPEAAYILQMANADFANIKSWPMEINEESYYLVSSLADKCWERIHTGHFSEVPLHIRKIYALANFYKIFYLLCESLTQAQVERCSVVLDEAILIGCTQQLYAHCDTLQLELTQYFNQFLGDSSNNELPILPVLPRQQCRCDIPTLNCPTIEQFRNKCFEAQQPTLLLDTIAHWPAMHKWRDLNYILQVAGNRTVPIEIGSNYTTEEWSQQLVKIRDFLKRQFPAERGKPQAEIEYLAQHELFDQIPALKADIRVPDYCTVRSNAAADSSAAVSIKAWLGPAGTISPLHFDPEHNILCQVFGRKRVILAAPSDTPKLYAHDTDMLCNTSQIDAAQLDLQKFPLLAQVRFYEVTLQAGDCLYMPPKWWHYVRAECASFSVSFWWS